LQLLGLWGFALWPLLDLWRRYPEFLAVHGLTAGPYACTVLALAVAPPLALFALESLLRRWRPRAAAALHLTLIAALLGVIAAPPLARLRALAGVVPLALALAIAIGATLLWRRWTGLRALTTLSCLTLPLFLGLAVASPAVREALRPAVAKLPAQSAAPGETPIVLIVFDELPLVSLLDDSLRIDRERYPNFARLADTSTWYPGATSVSHATLGGVSAILSGRYPQPDAQATLAAWPRNLFTLLWDSHPQHVMEPVTRLRPALRDGEGVFRLAPGDLSVFLRDSSLLFAHLLVPPSWRERLPPVDRNWIGFLDRSVDGRERELPGRRKELGFARWIEGIEPGARLHFAHTVLPHAPYRLYPSGRRYSLFGVEPSGAPGWDAWRGDEWAILHSQQRYLLQLGYVDQQLGRILDRLQAIGSFEPALVVVTADHGIAFRADANRRHLEDRNANEILAVPLFVKMPQQEQGRVSQLPAETIDILPTIVDALDLACDWEFDGSSLLSMLPALRTSKRAVTKSMRELPLALVTDFEAAVRRDRARFGGRGEARLFAVGPHAKLYGAPVESLRAAPTARRVRLAQGRPEFLVVEAEDLLAAELVGTLDVSPGESQVHLAIAVDGVVRALTRNYGEAGGTPRELWSALLPESALTPGAHRLEILEIATAADSTVRLHPVALIAD
jgi:hypothetical protein